MIKHLCMPPVVFLAMLLFVQPIMADTIVTDPVIDKDEHWTAEYSPYVAPEGLNIQAGATLTIDPGVVVKVGEGYYIYVAGTLDAEGVEFTKRDTDTSWGYISFDTAGSSTSRLERCTIRHAAGPVGVKFAIHVFSGTPEISGSQLSDCPAEMGIYVRGGSPDIHSTTFTGFSDCGIFVLGGSNPSVTGNKFTDNGYGIRATYNSLYPLNPSFT